MDWSYGEYDELSFWHRFWNTRTGKWRVRTWIIALFCATAFVYFALSFASLVLAGAGAEGAADPFWHAPAIAFIELLRG